MAFMQAAMAPGPEGRAMRLAALVILAIAVSLGVWRAASLLTGPDLTARSPAEASISGLVDPVAGAGRSRVSVTYNSEGGRTVFVLLDSAAGGAAPELRRILPVASGLDTSGADRLIIEQTQFARGLPGHPDSAAWMELGGLGLICLIAAGMAVASLRTRGEIAQSARPRSLPEREEAGPRPEPVRTLRPVAPAPLPADAADVARRDPARAAAVLRGWMQSREDAS